jgi:hypothetical protein
MPVATPWTPAPATADLSSFSTPMNLAQTLAAALVLPGRGPGRVHDALSKPRLGVVDDDEPADVGHALAEVKRVVGPAHLIRARSSFWA